MAQEKNGLLLVDIQNDYFTGGRMQLAGMEAAAARAADLLTLFRSKQWPVFFVQHIASGSNATFFLPDTDGAGIHESLPPAPGDVRIRKHFPNSFRETNLHRELQQAHVTRLVICGAMSHMCIDATTRAAADLGFTCVVVSDACATRDLRFGGDTIASGQVHGAFMAALSAAYAKVTSSEKLSRELSEMP